MKKTIGFLLYMATLCFGSGAYAQIPVTDVASITESLMQHGESIAKYMEQIDQMKKQYDQLEKQRESFNGPRGMSKLLKTAGLRKYLPKEWKKIYDKVQNGEHVGVSDSIAAIKKANSVLSDDQVGKMGQTSANTLNRLRTNAAVSQGTAEEAYTHASERIDYLDSLAQSIETADDPKAIMDLQASIALEQAQIQNEQIKMQLVAQLQQAEDRAESLRQREKFLKTAGPGSLRIQ